MKREYVDSKWFILLVILVWTVLLSIMSALLGFEVAVITGIALLLSKQ